jgi:predicted metal-dependent hydrolase
VSDLIVRNLSFDFDGVDFFWNPPNPEFALLANIISIQTIGFERFICRSMQEAQAHISDPEVLREIRDFQAQEMAHSKGHLAHVKSMIAQYPALESVFRESLADFDRKWEAHGLGYRLAYSAIIEATSLPLYKVIIEHRDKLLAGADRRVASLLLWHFCEEIEHRSTALLVYNEVVGRPFFRMRVFPDVGRHLAMNMRRIAARFAQHVPGVAELDLRRATARIPRWARLRMTASLFTSQLPFYNPSRGRVPDYCGEWARLYNSGEDMRIAPSIE